MQDCSQLLQFDISQGTTNIAILYSIFQFINKDNYESYKNSYSGSVPDYFSGDYNSFSNKKNKLADILQSTTSINIFSTYYQRSLSPEAAKAYASCVSENNKIPISSWVEAAHEEQGKIYIGVRCGLSGNVDVKYSPIGASPLNEPSILTGGSEEVLVFEYVPSSGFSVAFNCKVQQTNASALAYVSYPSNKVYKLGFHDSVKSATFRCGAGTDGNASKGAFSTSCSIVADTGGFLEEGSLAIVGQMTVGGPGIARYDLKIDRGMSADGKLISVTLTAINILGQSADTQGIVDITYSMTSKVPYVYTV